MTTPLKPVDCRTRLVAPDEIIVCSFLGSRPVCWDYEEPRAIFSALQVSCDSIEKLINDR